MYEDKDINKQDIIDIRRLDKGEKIPPSEIQALPYHSSKACV